MYILDAAEKAGLDLPATCRGGICGACVGRIASGGRVHDAGWWPRLPEFVGGVPTAALHRPGRRPWPLAGQGLLPGSNPPSHVAAGPVVRDRPPTPARAPRPLPAGKVDMSDIDDLSFTMSEDEQAQGMALLCMARATTDCTIETQCDWGYSLGVTEWKGATGRFSAAPDPLMGDSWTEGVKN